MNIKKTIIFTIILSFQLSSFNLHANEEVSEAGKKINKVFEKVFQCKDDCLQKNFSIESIILRIEKQFPSPALANNIKETHNFNYWVQSNDIYKVRDLVSNMKPHEVKKLEEKINLSLAPSVYRALQQKETQLLSRKLKLQFSYYWYHLIKDLPIDTIKNYSIPFDLLELETIPTSKYLESAENFLLTLKVCEVYRKSNCGSLYTDYIVLLRSELSQFSILELMEFNFKLAQNFSPLLHYIPDEYFASAYKVRKIIDSLHKLGALEPISTGLSFFIFFARDHTNLATNIFGDILFLVQDRAYKLIEENHKKQSWSNHKKIELIKEWLRRINIEVILKKKAEKGLRDDLNDGIDLLKKEGILNIGSWAKLYGLAKKKVFAEKVDNTGSFNIILTPLNTLRSDVHLSEIIDIKLPEESQSIGIAYTLNNSNENVIFEMEIKSKKSRSFFSEESKRTIFSGMGIMSNNTNTAPAWATGTFINGKSNILSEYWSPKRDGLLLIGKNGIGLEIKDSEEYINSVTKRRSLYEDLQSGDISFFSLGQLYLFKKRNLVSRAKKKKSGCVPQNILAQNREVNKVAFFKFFCSSAYKATEMIRSLGYSEAFNMDAQGSQYDYHVSEKDTLFSTPGVESISFAKFTAKSFESIKPKQDNRCTSSIGCSLSDFIKNYKTLNCAIVKDDGSYKAQLSAGKRRCY